MANTYISRTFGTPTNANIWTYSVWIKRSQLGADQCFFAAGTGSTDRTEISFSAADYIAVYRNIGGSTAGVETSERYRDTSGWYNFVFKNNNGTLTIYVNGETVTQNTSSLGTNRINQASVVHQIGEIVATGNPLNALMSHINFCDGTALAPTVFGSVDSTTGEWKINTAPSFTPGNNGFTILKDSNTITDQSANSNNFSLSSGTLTATKDCPDNVFATWNPLAKYNRSATFANGNTTVNSDNNSLWDSARGTFGFEKGKWYWETKFFGSSAAFNYIGVCNENAIMGTNDAYDKNAVTVFYNADGGEMRKDGNPTSANYGTFSTSEVCGVAVDADNNTISIYKNNSIIVTNYALSTSSIGNNGTGFIFPNAAVLDNGSGQYTNFGNGFFGTTAITTNSGNGYAGADGKSKFNYQPPSGYSALSTKGLNL